MPVPRGTGGLVSLSVIVILSGLIGLLLQCRPSRRRPKLLAGDQLPGRRAGRSCDSDSLLRGRLLLQYEPMTTKLCLKKSSHSAALSYRFYIVNLNMSVMIGILISSSSLSRQDNIFRTDSSSTTSPFLVMTVFIDT